MSIESNINIFLILNLLKSLSNLFNLIPPHSVNGPNILDAYIASIQ